MSRYIDADGIKYKESYLPVYHLSASKEDVDNVPTADVAPVVHAHWEYHECVCTDEGITGVYVCSACKAAVPEAVFDFFMEGFHKDFCGACGAQMDEEVKKDGTQ